MKKQCFKCGRTLEIEEFYPHKRSKDGHLNKCIECTKQDVLEYRKKNYKKVLEYEKKRSKTQKRKDNRQKYQTLYRNKHPDRVGIYLKVKRAIASGEIIKPKVCCICGATKKLEAHHYDYTKPLEVIFVCSHCHKVIHKCQQ